MSTYSTTEAALLAFIRTLNSGDTYTAANSSRGDFGVLNNDGVQTAAVLIKGGSSEFGDNLGQGRGAFGKRQQRHQIAIVLLRDRRQDTDSANYTALQSSADTLIAYLDQYPRLNNASGVKRAQAISDSEPRVRQGAAWMYQTILVEVITETEPALQEVAR